MPTSFTVAGQRYKVSKKIAARSPTFEGVLWGDSASIDEVNDQLVLVTEDGILLVRDETEEFVAWGDISDWKQHSAGAMLIIRDGSPTKMWLYGKTGPAHLEQVISEHCTALPPQAAPLKRVPRARITTLSELPGHRVVRVVGLITRLESASGFTAGMKGRDAFSKAWHAFGEDAYNLGGNAVLGVQMSTFGAGGGITSVLGGDAVGILMLGTAVVVEVRGDTSEQPAPTSG